MFKHGRNIISTLLIGFCCSQQGVAAINGHPDEDPVVKALRDAFAESVAPSAEEVVGKWKCQWFFAEEGDSRDASTEFEIAYVKNNVFQTQGGYSLRLQKDGLKGGFNKNSQILNIRINSKRFMIHI